jgi:hypothetical protein
MTANGKQDRKCWLPVRGDGPSVKQGDHTGARQLLNHYLWGTILGVGLVISMRLEHR